MQTCKCGDQIEFIKLKSGKLMPVSGNYQTIVTDDGDIVKGRISHFATCKYAKEFRNNAEPS